MSINSPDYTLLIFVLTILLVGAHAGGYISEKLHQPRVFGEILAGLVFGPTLFGYFFPGEFSAVLRDNQTIDTALGSFSQVGLLLLMFCSGNEICSVSVSWEKKTSLFIAVTGTLIPFAVGIILFRFWDLTAYVGRAQNVLAFVLVFAIAVAVTSIPVITRILYDLGILKSTFSRIVLSAAVLEDVVLYVVLAVALSLAGGDHRNGFDLISLTGLEAGNWFSLTYHALITLIFLLVAFRASPFLFRRIKAGGYSQATGSKAVALNLVLILMTTALGVFLGVSSIFGALVAGMIVSGPVQNGGNTFEVIKNFSFAFFIPLYFVSVGLKLDLHRNFDLYFFVAFFVVACLAKVISIYAGALLAGENRWGSLNLAVAMNARGGPGIVLAVVSLEAGIINESFYTSLVLLSLFTSFLAGIWLSFVIRKRWPLL
jgi:Kef-type K+ transport system membrane component KefB